MVCITNVFVRANDSLYVLPPLDIVSTTTADLCESIATLTGIPPTHQHLSLGGTPIVLSLDRGGEGEEDPEDPAQGGLPTSGSQPTPVTLSSSAAAACPVLDRLQSGSTIDVMLRLEGGAQLGKAVKGRRAKPTSSSSADVAAAAELQLQERILRMERHEFEKKLALEAQEVLKSKLKTERRFSRVNQLKITNQWRKILRRTKVESLRRELEITSQNHERDVDRRDAIIQMLDRDVEEAEEQFQMTRRRHAHHVDSLIDLQDLRLLRAESEFESTLKTLESDFRGEAKKIEGQHESEKYELLGIIRAVESEELERGSERRQEHEQTREEIRNKNLEDINVLRITLDGLIEELEAHFETAHLNYLQTTDQRTQDFKFLTAKDRDLSRDIELKSRRMDKLQTSLSQWRTKLSQNSRESTERNAALRQEKDAISGHFQTLKSKLNQERERNSKSLVKLASDARATKETLASHLALASRILSSSALARELETERERILPFYASSVGTEEVVMSQQEDHESEEGTTQNHSKEEEWTILDNFWKRYNKVLLDEFTLASERSRLEAENAQLQHLLQQYLDGISVSAGTLDGPNPLMVINGRVTLNQPPPRSGTTAASGPNVILEGNQIVQNYARH